MDNKELRKLVDGIALAPKKPFVGKPRHRDGIDPDKGALQPYKGKWKNLIFANDGKSYLGLMEHQSKEAAINASLNAKIERNSGASKNVGCIGGDKIGVSLLSGKIIPGISWDDYSHSIQVPWQG